MTSRVSSHRATVTDARADENTLVWFARLDVELYVIHDLTPEPNGYLVPTAYRGAAHEPVSIVQYTAAARERRLYENVMQ